MDEVLLPSASTDKRTFVRPLWFSISGSTTISCNSYDSGGVVVIVTATDCRVVVASVGEPSSTTTTVAAGRGRAVVAGGSPDLIALRGGFKVVDDGSMTDKVASVFAAMAAGGGTAVTIGPPSTTGEATALVACVVAMAVAEVDAEIGMTDCTVVVVDAANVGATAGGKESNVAEADAVDVVLVVIVAATVGVGITVFTPLSGDGRTTSFGGASALDDAVAPAVNCFLGKRGDNLTGGRMAVGFAATVGLEPAAVLVDGCDRLGVLGDLSGSGDLGGTSLRGVGGNFLRGDDLTDAVLLTVGTVGGFPVATDIFRPPATPLTDDGCLVDEPDVRFPVADRSLVDADSRLLLAVMAVGRRLLSTIRDSDD